MDPRGLAPLRQLGMWSSGAGHGVPVAALLGILATALLIPEVGALCCYSHSSVLNHDREGKPLKTSVAIPNSTEFCSLSHSACIEVFITFSTGGTSVTVIQRGCSDEHHKGGTKPLATPHGFLHVQTHVHYCQADLCNAKEIGLGTTSQGTTPAPSGPTQCYAGLSLDPQPHRLERVTCDGADAHCYHGNGTLTAEKLTVPIFVWHCQASSCVEPPTRKFGPVQLSQAGTCCSRSYCNAQGALKPFSGKPHGRKIPGYDPLHSTTADGVWKGHENPGLINGTAAPHPDSNDYTTDLPYTNPEETDYDVTGLVPEYPHPDHPGHKGDTHSSAWPHSRTTEPNEKNRYPKYTLSPGHEKHGAHKSQAPGLGFCPLLVMLGISLLGL